MKSRKSSIGLLIVCAVVVMAFVCGQVRFEKSIAEESYLYGDTRTVITVLAGQSTSDAGVEDMIDEMVEEKFPEIKLEWECVDWGESFAPHMRGRLAAGDAPDIIIGKVQDVCTYAESGNLAPLEVQGIENVDADVLDFVTIDGNIYGLPYNAWYQGVIYNRGIFEQYHLEVPRTMKELEEVVEVLEANRVTPFAAHFQENWKVANMTMQFMINDTFRQQPDWGERFERGEVSFQNNPEVVHCIEQNRYILEHSWADALTIEQYESDRRFVEGEAAMYLAGSWSLQNIGVYDTSVHYGIFPYPNHNGDAELIKETNMAFMVSRTSAHQEIINELLEELIQNKKVMREILGFTQTYPVVSGLDMFYEDGVEKDIASYEEAGKVVDAFIGNSQLRWEFQSQLAVETQKWLRGEAALETVLESADENREESSSIISK